MDILLGFASFWSSFFNAFFSGFYNSIWFLFNFLEDGFPRYFLVFLILQIIIVIFNIRFAIGKGYSGFLCFLLCLAVPLFGCFTIIALLPDRKETNDNNILDNNQLKNNQLIINRLENDFESSSLLNVSIDNRINFDIGNGEEKTIDIQNGKHFISVSFNNVSKKKDFEINNNGKIISININPLKIIEEI